VFSRDFSRGLNISSARVRLSHFPTVLVALLAFFVSSHVAAQPTATLTANVTTYAPTGGQVVFSATINYATVAEPSALGFSLTIPMGWALVSTGGANTPQLRPPAGTTGALDYAFTSPPAQSASFTITASYPAGLVGDQTTFASAVYRAPVTTISLPPLTITGTSTGTAIAPTITAQPVNATVLAGQSVAFSVMTTGTPAPTYQWRRNGAALAGQTSVTLSLSNVSASDAGNYDVVVTNSAGAVTSVAAVLTINVAPTISSQPASQVVAQGQIATFSVSATGTPAPTFQWRKNGTSIAGANSSRFSVNGATSADAGSYDVVVANVAGSRTSNSATLTVNAPVVGAPVITQLPVGQTVTVGTSVTLAVTATGTALTYQWRRDGESLANATGATLVLTGATAVSGSYSVIVTNSAGAVSSSAAAVQFLLLPGRPAITLQPVGRTLVVGATATLFVEATGVGALGYQWFKDGRAITGATAQELALGPVTLAAGGAYSATVTNANGTSTTAAATIAVSDRASAPVILTQPAPQIVLAGATATFSVEAFGHPAPQFQWRRNGAAVTGATFASFSIPNTQLTNMGVYDVAVTNSAGTASSSLATLSVANAATLPVIYRQPAPVSAVAGRSVALSVVASGAPEVAYQWQRNGIAISGATTATLRLAPLNAAQAGLYTVVVSNGAGRVTSAEAALTVLARSYAGYWFGTLGGNGSFALRINDDNTGEFLGFLPGTRTAFVSRDVGVDAEGRIQIKAASVAGGPNAAAAPQAGAPGAVVAAAEASFSGTISSSGSLAGSLTGSSAVTLAAARAADTGAAAAGFYQAGANGSSAQTNALVGPQGQVLAVVQAGATVDAGTGTLDATGKVTLTTAAQQTVAATVSPDSAAFSAVVTDGKGVTTSYSGYAAGAGGLAEQRLVNISTRTTAGVGEQVAIVGFVISGLESKPVLIRAVGPTLGSFGVETALRAPELVLNRGSNIVARNTGWTTAGNSPAIAAAAARSGAFPLGETSADSVLLLTLAPGTYSAVVSAADGRAGVGLVEVYDLSGASLAQKLTNISTRALAGAGDATLIAGVVVGGSAPKRLLIRAAGPALTQFGLTGVLAKPQLTLISENKVVAQNSGWSTSGDAVAIAEAAARVGGFPFANSSDDAALILNLSPGAYTAQVTGGASASGVVLVEVYELP
jgi:hypothetical protein